MTSGANSGTKLGVLPGVGSGGNLLPVDILLASASPRRSELLSGIGLVFQTVPADIDETPLPDEHPRALVARLSLSKAEAAARRRPDALVVAADTVVVVDGQIMNKPADEAENRGFLTRLSGRRHTVLTGHTLCLGGRRATVVTGTEVWFRELEEGEVSRYAASREGLDKAGGYAIQGRGAALVSRIEGCYANVVGLSVPTVVEAARRLGVSLV